MINARLDSYEDWETEVKGLAAGVGLIYELSN